MNVNLNKNKKFLVISLLAVIIPFIALAVFFGLFDLQISYELVDSNSWWGNFGADFGESLGYGLIGISFAIFFGSFIKKEIYQKIPAFVFTLLGIGVIIYGIIADEEKAIIISAAITISLLVFTLVTLKKDWKVHRKFAMVVLILALVNPLFLVLLLKFLCGRVRYRDLELGFTNYTPWYLPPGPSSHHSSFPSGHTAMGWMILPLLLLFRTKKRKLWAEILGTILILFWGIFVAMSRVRVGAHYASDVLFSTFFAFITMIILYSLFYLRKKPNIIIADEIAVENSN